MLFRGKLYLIGSNFWLGQGRLSRTCESLESNPRPGPREGLSIPHWADLDKNILLMETLHLASNVWIQFNISGNSERLVWKPGYFVTKLCFGMEPYSFAWSCLDLVSLEVSKLLVPSQTSLAPVWKRLKLVWHSFSYRVGIKTWNCAQWRPYPQYLHCISMFV